MTEKEREDNIKRETERERGRVMRSERVSVESLAVSQLCLGSQGREAGRGRQAGCSGPGPGHTLGHAAQERAGPERGGRGGGPGPRGTSTGPGGPIVPPKPDHLTHLVPSDRSGRTRPRAGRWLGGYKPGCGRERTRSNLSWDGLGLLTHTKTTTGGRT